MSPTELRTDANGSHGEGSNEPLATLSTSSDDNDDRISDAVGAIRATASQVGDRVPVVVDTIRDGARESARSVQALPEDRQQMLAAFSLGLSLGLSITGAPRLIVAATLAPAIYVTAILIGRNGAA